MPTTSYTKREGSTVGFGGKEYPIVDGAVSVPDDAVPALLESHGFTATPPKDAPEAPEKFDLALLTKNQLIETGVELGAELKSNMTKDEIFALVKPLWEAKQAEKAA